jgi:hypothetical protein
MSARRAAWACLALGACGYHTGSLMPEGVRSIAVQMASNDTFYRQDEFVYTRRLTQELIRKAKVTVRDRRDADAVLESRILRLGRVPLVEGENDVLLEEGFVGVVEVVLREKGTGRVIDTFVVRRRAEGIRPRGEDLDFERARLAEELAEDTVVALERRSYLLERGLVGR